MQSFGRGVHAITFCGDGNGKTAGNVNTDVLSAKRIGEVGFD
jgi:hypothetical protein